MDAWELHTDKETNTTQGKNAAIVSTQEVSPLPPIAIIGPGPAVLSITCREVVFCLFFIGDQKLIIGGNEYFGSVVNLIRRNVHPGGIHVIWPGTSLIHLCFRKWVHMGGLT